MLRSLTVLYAAIRQWNMRSALKVNMTISLSVSLTGTHTSTSIDLPLSLASFETLWESKAMDHDS